MSCGSLYCYNCSLTTSQLSPNGEDSLEDPVLSQAMKFCTDDWPAKHTIKGKLKVYWNVHNELFIFNQLLLCNSQGVLLKSGNKFLTKKFFH